MKYIERKIDKELSEWKNQQERMPLLLRGARQVGKTSSVRHLGQQFKNYVEVDLNRHEDYHAFFGSGLSPQEICRQLSFAENKPIVPGETLLFIDEIQACPAAINSLRYFYEQYPELHVVAAGSLLEFVLAELPSFGVGRVRSAFMYPLCFEEFLTACGERLLAEAYREASPSQPLSETIHDRLVRRLKTFMVIGGMPKAVAAYVEHGDLNKCQMVLNDLYVSYFDDFKKYNRRVPSERVVSVLEAVARQRQGRFVYSNVNDNLTLPQVKQAVELLLKAGLIYSVKHTSANGIPLGAEVNDRYQRLAVFDTGLLQRILQLDLRDIYNISDVTLVNNGNMAENLVATELIKAHSCYEPCQLYCWHREKSGSQAEVDFVVQRGYDVIPIEVKAGTRGAMQSLRIFMAEKRLDYGIRTSLENFAQYDDIRVYPLYAISNMMR